MEQPSLLDWTPPATHRFGSTYSAALDESRLNAQALRVWGFISDGGWYTLSEIHAATGDPEASISARLRDFANLHGLKKERRRRDGKGTHEYRVTR